MKLLNFYFLMVRFNDGENDGIKIDSNREGADRPRKSGIDEWVQEVRFLFDENFHITSNEIEGLKTILHSTAYRITTKDLQIKNFYSKWVPLVVDNGDHLLRWKKF